MITTHVLDTSRGRPAQGVAIELEREDRGVWNLIGAGVTDADGRLRTLTPEGPLHATNYRIRFQTGLYFQAQGATGFFPVVEIHFTISDANAHYHVPLLLSPYGYSTYRGS
jgi:5-hydroxyisourate hydrolase